MSPAVRKLGRNGPDKASRIALVHGDFWPGNVLWLDGNFSGVIDWEDAGIEDPMYDVAISRLDLTLIFGEEAAREFLSAYAKRGLIDEARLTAWEVFAATRAEPFLAAWGEQLPALGRPDLIKGIIRDRWERFLQSTMDRLG
jgi:aminoglycoside phosphotransferase (APT) family kinase protein